MKKEKVNGRRPGQTQQECFEENKGQYEHGKENLAFSREVMTEMFRKGDVQKVSDTGGT